MFEIPPHLSLQPNGFELNPPLTGSQLRLARYRWQVLWAIDLMERTGKDKI